MTHRALFVALAVCLCSGCATWPVDEIPAFVSAKPVWPDGREREMNLHVGFRAVFDSPPAGEASILRVTASTLYHAWVNGRFVGHGPARGPHGWFRVDEWSLAKHLVRGRNVVAIEVAGYNANSYYVLDQPSFLQAEVVAGASALASTGSGTRPFEACLLTERVQKVQRYSFQRPFIEMYRLRSGHDRWRTDPDPKSARPPVACRVQPPISLLPRRVPYTSFRILPARRHIGAGRIERVGMPEKPWKDRSLVNVGTKLAGYPETELEAVPSLELQALRRVPGPADDRALHPGNVLEFGPSTYRIVDFGVNRSGFLKALVICRQPVRLVMTFDEILRGGDVDFKRLSCVNAVVWELAPGRYELESFEPYTLRYLKIMALEGGCRVARVALREYANDDTGTARFDSDDRRLNRIFEAARETFRQNAIDLFMDCPSRERAGWLCDSFFTARAAYALNGHACIERCQYENYLLPERFPHLPDGMLPMCYPADHRNGNFIPNWALWFVVQLEEYLARTGDRAMVDALEPRVMALFAYFDRFRNDDGLLEKLEKWIFVEWSKANSFVQDVNYPTNILYAAALDAAGRMYERADLASQASRIREVVRRQSFDGTFFVDNAVRRNGNLVPTRNRTEVCQYFAFYFKVATPESHPRLWKSLVEEFGPRRRKTGAHPEIHPANMIVGLLLRAELLSRAGLCRQLVGEIADDLHVMAERTGTLWEHVDERASCCHGFASHAAHVLFRDVLGIYHVSVRRRYITLRFTDIDLDRCRGTMPTPDGPVTVDWRRVDGKIVCKVEIPDGYALKLENLSGHDLSTP
jgi:alpha-L-rhamnosidase